MGIGGRKWTNEQRKVIYQKIYDRWLKLIQDDGAIRKVAAEFELSETTVHNALNSFLKKTCNRTK